MTGHHQIVGFLRQCHGRMLAAARDLPNEAPERTGTDALDRALHDAVPIEFEPTWLPALDTIDQLRAQRSDPLVQQFIALAPSLPWSPTTRSTDGGRNLALAPFNQTLELGATTVGLMYVSPGATYPLHQHPPRELYLTLAGTGHWRYGGRSGIQLIEPGALLYNPPETVHQATARSEPLLALYVLWET